MGVFYTKKKHLSASSQGFKQYLANQWIGSKLE